MMCNHRLIMEIGYIMVAAIFFCKNCLSTLEGKHLECSNLMCTEVETSEISVKRKGLVVLTPMCNSTD